MGRVLPRTVSKLSEFLAACKDSDVRKRLAEALGEIGEAKPNCCREQWRPCQRTRSRPLLVMKILVCVVKQLVH